MQIEAPFARSLTMAVFASGANDSDVIMKVGVYCNGDAAVGGIAQSLTCNVKTEILSTEQLQYVCA